MALRKIQSGFTLLEVMIVVAIVAILAAVAIPNYSEYVERSKLTEGTLALMDLRLKMERAYQDTYTYADACGAVNKAGRYFSYTCESSSAESYLLKATSVSDVGLGAAGAYVYTLDSNDAKKTAKFKDTSVGATCWMLKKADQC